ncbi:histidine kinase [Antarcticirhabdus aurantiaca]|uniref:Histidine kinase n=1 Tax=Antarcticirhabdus aurantiaca TaxID=2606717 RepID=A0ACD4NQM6_9HYPH|nr:histidine kinase [Antarcticirhabdus aurantiaca]WAJ28970.1 histidine kinase [Jeongeuplla avenae]
MKTLLLGALAALALGSAASAETLQFPSDAPVASITVPEGWTGEETEAGGIQAFSPDETVSFYVDVAASESAEKVLTDAASFLDENGVTIDAASQQDGTGTINGMQAGLTSWNGQDENGPVKITLAAVTASPQNLLIITYWASQEGGETNDAAVQAMVNSLTPAP